MAVYKRGDVWWYSFLFAGRRIQESAKTASKTVARGAEKERRRSLEKTLAGLPQEDRRQRIATVTDVVRLYKDSYALNHRPASVAFSRACLSQIEQHLGQRLISDLDQRRVLDYVRVRQVAGASGRTINAELGELSRAIGRTWRELWPRVKKLEENMGVGKALTSEEEARLLKAADDNRSRLSVLIRVALQTGMRAGELTSLQWRQVDFEKKLITVGKAKTANGTGRIIPMNPNLAAVLSVHADWYRKRFEEVRPEWFVFPFGSPYPSDPARPTVELKTAWNTVRSAAGVSCRWHDLRHTACTKMAEAGVSEGTMLAIMGHMSRAMLERYSHIRMAAKREAVESLALSPNVPNSKPISTVSTTVAKTSTMQ